VENDRYGWCDADGITFSPRVLDGTAPTIDEAIAGAVDLLKCGTASVIVCHARHTDDGEPSTAGRVILRMELNEDLPTDDEVL